MTDQVETSTTPHPADLAAAALRESEIANALTTMEDILAELEAGNGELAQVSADYLKEALADLEDDLRAEVIRHIRTWITANAKPDPEANTAHGKAAADNSFQRHQLSDLVGIPLVVPLTKAADDMREAALASCITQAAAEEDTRRRDELILAGMAQLAHLGPLAIVRWRKVFSKSLGIDRASFDQLLNAAKETGPAHANGNGHSNGDKPRGPVGVYGASAIKDGALHFLGEPLGNFAAKITHELIVDDGLGPPTVRYTVEGHLAAGPGLGSVDVPAEEFQGMGWLAKHWGARPVLYVSPSKAWLVRRAIQEVSLEEMVRERVHTFTGWTTLNSKPAFLTTSGAITPEGFDDKVRVELGDERLAAYALPTPPDDPREALRASFDFLKLAPLPVTLPIWAAMYAAPLTPFFRLNAMLWVYGRTQSRKSTLALLALTHFGPRFVTSREYHAPQDWLSTVTDIQATLFAAKDLPLVMDDFAPQSENSTAKDMHKKAHMIVRLVGNRSQRGRRRQDLSAQKGLPPRGIALATAEVPLYGASIVGRAIFVPVEMGMVALSEDGDGPLDRAQAAAGVPGPGLYAQGMAAYIKWLAANWDRAASELSAEHALANQFARAHFPSSQSRLMDYFAVLMTAARTVARFALNAKAITRADHDRAVNEEWPAALVGLLQLQSERVANQSPVIKFCMALADLLAQRRAYMAPRLGEEPPPPTATAKLIGWYDKTPPRIYLITNACLELVREYWQAVGEPLDIMGDAMRGELDQAGLVPERDAGQFEKSTYTGPPGGKSTRRTLWFDTDKAETLTGYRLWPDREFDDNDDPDRPLPDEL